MITGTDLLISFINLALCIAIVILGFIGYKKHKDILALSLGFAYLLFAFSHFVMVLGETVDFAGILIAVRIVAYLVIIFALGKRVV